MLLSPKAQRDRERKSVQIKRAPTDKSEEHWDTESKLGPQIQTSSKVPWQIIQNTQAEREGDPQKKGINERGIRLYQTDPYTYQGQRSNRLRSCAGFLASYYNGILVVLALSSNTSVTFLTKLLLVNYMLIKKMVLEGPSYWGWAMMLLISYFRSGFIASKCLLAISNLYKILTQVRGVRDGSPDLILCKYVHDTKSIDYGNDDRPPLRCC